MPKPPLNNYLKIYERDEFTPVSPKQKGSRPGCFGYIDDKKFLLKVENFAYDLQCTNSLEEAVVLESLVSQIIRAIFGESYASDIALISIKGSEESPKIIKYTTNDIFGNIKYHTLPIYCKYAVLSAWEDNCYDSIYMKNYHLSAIQTIVKLLNVDDYKLENIVRREDDSLFIVDCAADLAGYKNLKQIFDCQHANVNLKQYFNRDIAINIIKQFVEFDISLIKNILDDYQVVLSPKTREKLLNNFQITQSQYRLLLNSENQLTFFNNGFQKTENKNITNDKYMPDIQTYKKIA